jgi:hypothetical protein
MPNGRPSAWYTGSASREAPQDLSHAVRKAHLMAPRTVRPLARSLAIAGFAATVTLGALAGSAAADEQRFDITGTVVEVKGDQLIILTSDVIGKPQPITVDVSQLGGLQIAANTPIQLTIVSRENDSFLATGIVRESPYVNGADFGVREELTVRQDSIQAGVGNVPADDEALNQQHRTNDLHHRDKNEDDDGNKKKNK